MHVWAMYAAPKPLKKNLVQKIKGRLKMRLTALRERRNAGGRSSARVHTFVQRWLREFFHSQLP